MSAIKGMNAKQLTTIKIVNAITISCERVEVILHDELGMTYVSKHWVSRLLTPDEKRNRSC